MCGSENDFSSNELSRVVQEQWGTERDTTLFGNCRQCGEMIDLGEEPQAVESTPPLRRWEAVAAFLVLTAVLGLFVVGLLSMIRE